MSYNPYAYATSEQNGVNDRFSHTPQQQRPMQIPRNTPVNGQGNANMNANVNGSGGGFPFQDPRGSMAFQLGQSAFSNFIGQDNFNQFQETVNKATANAAGSQQISTYFQVSTRYVINKLKLILVPFLNGTKNWQRIMDSGNFLPPRDDVNSPDMYMPIMGLVTYILIWNTQQGLKGSFNPEDLYYKLSSTLAFVCLDLLILKLGLYLLIDSKIPSFSLVELLCYVGYKFVPLILAQLLTNVTMPFNLNILIKFYLFIAFGVFLLRSVKFNLLSRSGAEDDDIHVSISKSTVKKCNYFLFVYGFIWQNVLMWLMG
ncbi:AQG_2a_G0044940.mRNA.1.CDS.1 [Saccharomyces cerevisiae]|uniref:Protein transport protein YIF1 n=5 Tax=Saccharomyces TaxID=4930 RepID=YIF1_YEAST|eukprot:NP_014136.1 Yif1p [Saccharomyces cerevisiae S288C]